MAIKKDDYTISLIPYKDEVTHLQIITDLIQDELSEPYIIYTYRYFLNQWPHLCYLAFAHKNNDEENQSTITTRIDPSSVNQEEKLPDGSTATSSGMTSQTDTSQDLDSIPIGVIVSKLDRHLKGDRLMRGYIAMLSVDSKWRRRGVASLLVKTTLQTMIENGAQEIVLETEVDNSSSLALYQHLGFIKEKRLYRFYLNGKDSFRLILPIPKVESPKTAALDGHENQEQSSNSNFGSGLSPIVDSSMSLNEREII